MEGGQIADVNADLCPASLSCYQHYHPPPLGPRSPSPPRQRCPVSVACSSDLVRQGSV